MLITKEVQIKWTKRNRKIYEEKGYRFTDYGDYFNLKIEDLSKGNHAIIQYSCDFCGEIVNANYNNYANRNNTEIDTCKNCKGQKNAILTLDKRRDYLYSDVLRKCNELGYELLTDKDSITGNVSRIEYKCPKHGIFDMRIANLLSGKKCHQCDIDNRRLRYKLDINEVEERIKNCGGKLLNPQDYINQYEKNLKIICENCGNTFITSLVQFTQHGGQVCEKCRKDSESIGEKKIRYYLERNNIQFEQEYWFPDCKDVNVLPFDFYLPDYNTIIEFDGRQHFGSTTFFKHSQEMTPIHDEIKNNYCYENDINLIRIPYWEIDKIDAILNEHLMKKFT